MELMLRITAQSEIPADIDSFAWRDRIRSVQDLLTAGVDGYADIIYRRFPGGDSLAILHGPSAGNGGIDFGTGPVWGAVSSDHVLTVATRGDPGEQRQYDIRDGSSVECAQYLG